MTGMATAPAGLGVNRHMVAPSARRPLMQAWGAPTTFNALQLAVNPRRKTGKPARLSRLWGPGPPATGTVSPTAQNTRRA
jgi:hypothetical protein